MRSKDVQVCPGFRRGWAVLRSGNERASKIFETRGEAIRYARAIAKKEKSILSIHRDDGLVSQRISYNQHEI